MRIAQFGEVHSGFGQQVKVPRNVNVNAAHVGVADLIDGSSLRVAVLPTDTVHAPADLSALHAASWYEKSGKGVARVRYSIDADGIRADGLLFDDIDQGAIDRLTAASASGDWRSAVAMKRFEDFEHTPSDFVGSCIVNIPGYSDTFTQATGQRFSLAASANSILSIEDDSHQETPVPELETTPAADAHTTCTICAPTAAPMVTLSASALTTLLETITSDGSSDATSGSVDDAFEEADKALTAAGVAPVGDDPIVALSKQVHQLSTLVASMVFAQPDDA